MSVVDKESIEVIAQSIGVGNLSPDVLPSLAADIEYRVREIMQEAIKCMRHAKRTAMTSEDVDTALDLRKMEPIYVASGDCLGFKRAKDLFYLDDKDVEFREVLEAPLPKAALDTALVNHWLAIEGVQPAIPENLPLEALVTPVDNNKKKEEENKSHPAKHVLSLELQLYFEKMTDLTVTRPNSLIFNKALLSLATDAGLHPLLPYFIYFVAEEVTRNVNNFQLLFALMRLVRSLVQNPFLHLEPYLIQLMPSVMTCLVAKTLGNSTRPTDNHWELRNLTASLVATMCRRFGHGYHNLQLRVTRTLVHAFMDPSKGLAQHYGAIKGMAALGSSVVRLLLLPNLDLYLQFLEPEMKKNDEAWRVHGALLSAAGLCVYNQLKMIPNLLSPPTTQHKNNPNKRKAEPIKKADSVVKVEMQGSGFSITRGGFMPNETIPVPVPVPLPLPIPGRRDRFVGGQTSSSVAVARAWKKEINAGHLLPKLFDLFGESMLPFVPSPELCNIYI